SETEVRPIESIQETDSTFDVHSLINGNALQNVEVEAGGPRTKHHNAIAELSRRGRWADVRSGWIKGAAVSKGSQRIVYDRLRQPIDDAARVFTNLNEVLELFLRDVDQDYACLILIHRGASAGKQVRRSRLNARYAANLPVANHPFDDRVFSVEEMLAWTERQFVDVIKLERLP